VGDIPKRYPPAIKGYGGAIRLKLKCIPKMCIPKLEISENR